ncbi:uncharacterized protein LOC105698511 isoform X2 [Orussus abietinus]|uniref:uncharacterized protein LOC105698511 isoform X2 n=1 Tax=Orussus abietinus TaxID=222816 RepID=UPI000C71609D|nr:uncharacterized protein LOC105698511 isoform X2 [Orussus abietinus]
MTATDSMEPRKRKQLVNPNLISLKCLLFVFFSGLGCLFPLLPLHMVATGLTMDEIRLVSIISGAVAILGPLIAGPIADKLAGRQGSEDGPSNGRYLRIMIAITCILSAAIYALLLLVPVVNRIDLPQERRPSVKFSCDRDGARIHQERCRDTKACHRWSEERPGPILLEDCKYTCKSIVPRKTPFVVLEDDLVTPGESTLDTTDYLDLPEGSGDTVVNPLEDKESRIRRREPRYVIAESEPPHLCFKDASGNAACHVYTEFSENFSINASLKQAVNNDDFKQWCQYPVGEYFNCRIPGELVSTMAEFNQSCTVECDLVDPYTLQGSVLSESQCRQVIGNPEVTFWMYLTIRSVGDVFPTAGVALLNAAIVIATRETSCGRGDVGRQLAFGSLGFAIFGPLSGYLTSFGPAKPAFLIPICLFAGLMILASIIVLCASDMPLTPPEWWWHTRSGMLALPMSAVKRYGTETAALVFILVVLGIFWSVMDSYLPLHLANLKGDELSIGLTLTIGALPAVLFLWKSEHLVDYCGHSNLLITAFTIYIVRFTGLSLVPDPWWALIFEALELFTLGVMWVTAILYLRHLVPRHLTVTAQALPVIAHFCVGRSIGAAIGAYVVVDGTNPVDSLRFVYRCMAAAAAIVAILYFILYHGLLKPRCHAQTSHGPRQPPTIVQAAIQDYELSK